MFKRCLSVPSSPFLLCTAPISRPPVSMHLSLLLLVTVSMAFVIWPFVLGEPVFSLDQLARQNHADNDMQQQQEEHSSPTNSLLSSVTLTKCQSDYLSALTHRCMIRGTPTMMEDRICFADEVQLEDVHKLISYISEMCCLLRCQAKTLERLCCRHAQQQGRCRKANCLPIRNQKVLWEEAH